MSSPAFLMFSVSLLGVNSFRVLDLSVLGWPSWNVDVAVDRAGEALRVFRTSAR